MTNGTDKKFLYEKGRYREIFLVENGTNISNKQSLGGKVLKHKKIIKRIIIIALVVALLWIFFDYENNHLQLSSYTFKTDKVSKEFTIVQISDFHNKVMDNKKITTIVKNQKPDIIALTGDLVDANRTNINVAINMTKELVNIAPVYYITGNHERAIKEEKYQQLEQGLENIGVKVLVNNVVNLDNNICIIGLDDKNIQSKDDTLNQLTKDLSDDKFKILLAHEPQEIDWYAQSGVDLVLSGHAHGGQIRIPFTNIGLVAPSQGLFPKYTAGKYESGDTTMFVSRGIGNSILPLRVFNCPEIVKVTIKNNKTN